MTPESRSPPLVVTGRIGRPKRILIVDDDPELRAQMVTLLRRLGNQVDTAEDGETAWAALLSTPFDLIVTDHFMPKVSGLALARRIRVAHLPVLVVLASEKLEEADTLNLSHDPWSRLDGFVHKPFNNDVLLAAVRSLLPESGTTSPSSEFDQPQTNAFGPADFLPSHPPTSAIA